MPPTPKAAKQESDHKHPKQRQTVPEMDTSSRFITTAKRQKCNKTRNLGQIVLENAKNMKL